MAGAAAGVRAETVSAAGEGAGGRLAAAAGGGAEAAAGCARAAGGGLGVGASCLRLVTKRSALVLAKATMPWQGGGEEVKGGWENAITEAKQRGDPRGRTGRERACAPAGGASQRGHAVCYLAGIELLLLRRDEHKVCRVQVLVVRSCVRVMQTWRRRAGVSGLRSPRHDCARERERARGRVGSNNAGRAGREARLRPHQAKLGVVGVDKQRLEVGNRARVRGLNRHLRARRARPCSIHAPRVRDAPAGAGLCTPARARRACVGEPDPCARGGAHTPGA